jgi:hypothetical protein
MYNISIFYPYIYEEKFKKSCFLHTDSGWIKSNKNIYLNLEDLNMVEDLGNILDFYRKIEKEGDTYRINVCGKKYTVCCNNISLHMCINCNIYLCNDCESNHKHHTVQKNVCPINISNTCSKCQIYTLEPMIYTNNKKICNNCYKNNKNNIVVYTKPVIENFNMYEWIPINGYLENRNINSHLYNRKMSIEFNDNYIMLRLLDNYYVDIESDYMLKMFEKLGVHENLSNNIFRKIGICNIEKTYEIKKYKTVIISK